MPSNFYDMKTIARDAVFNNAEDVIPDPGASGAISVAKSGVCRLTSAGAETRTMVGPLFTGQRIKVGAVATLTGTIVLTIATLVNQTGNNTCTLASVDDWFELVGVNASGGTLRWRIAWNDGVALSTV